MDSRCQGFNATDTAACEECHRSGGTWVIRPDGSMICSHAATYDPGTVGPSPHGTPGADATGLIVGLVALVGAVFTGTQV